MIDPQPFLYPNLMAFPAISIPNEAATFEPATYFIPAPAITTTLPNWPIAASSGLFPGAEFPSVKIFDGAPFKEVEVFEVGVFNVAALLICMVIGWAGVSGGSDC